MTTINVKEIREKLKLSTQQLADRIGVTRFTVNRWESGKSNPHSVFVKIMEKLEEEYENGKHGKQATGGTK